MIFKSYPHDQFRKSFESMRLFWGMILKAMNTLDWIGAPGVNSPTVTSLFQPDIYTQSPFLDLKNHRREPTPYLTRLI